MATTTLVSLIRSYSTLDESDVISSEIPSQIAGGLITKDWKLINIVQGLGEVLVSEIDAVRLRGITLLSAVVAAIDKFNLDRQSTKTLTTFFVDKLADPTSLIASVTALTGLTESPGFGVGEGMEVARSIFASVKLQSFPQSTRFLVYTLIDALLLRSRPALKRLGKEFTAAYCAMAEGEKDPRNLMLSFSIVKVILLEFDISSHIEDLFDITFCYFPITFTPPHDDPYGITSDELVIALRECLCATPHFGTLALPLFLDKMQAASEKAKRQTLQALTACFPIYGAAACGEWAGRFSEALSIEVFHATDNDTMELALTTFQSLFSTLYPDVTTTSIVKLQTVDEDEEMPSEAEVEKTNPTGVSGIGVKVAANSLDELREPDKSNAKPATRILAALILSSNRLAHYTISLVVPQLLALFKNPDEVSLRAPVLISLSTLLAALSSLESSTQSLNHTEGQSPLEPFRDDLLSVFTSGSRSTTSRPPALEGLVNLIKITGFLSVAEVGYCIAAINDVLLSPEGEDQYDTALEGLVTISILHPRIIEESTLPLLFTALPSEVPAPSSPASEAYRRSLSSLSALCLHPSLFEILSLRLLARLEGLCSLPFIDPNTTSYNALYAHHLLMTLRVVLKKKVDRGDEDIAKYVEKFVPRLMAVFILPTTQSEESTEGNVALDVRLLDDAGKVVTIILQRVEVGRQSIFLSAIDAAFRYGKLESLLSEQAKQAGASNFLPLSSSSTSSQRNLIILFTASVLPMRPTVQAGASDILILLRELMSICLDNGASEVQRLAGMQGLGAGINKWMDSVPELLSIDIGVLWKKIVAADENVESRKVALRVWGWIIKALVTRSDQRGYVYLDQILSILDDQKLAGEVAKVLGMIGEESDRVISKENYGVIRLLYKQRFFAYLLPKVVAGHKSAYSSNQSVYLVALSSLLQHIPKQMSLTELPKLLPLLITALDLPDANLRANVIETLGVLVKEVPKEMESSISGIVTKVLKALLVEADSASIKLKLSILAFLLILPDHIPYSILHSQKNQVLVQLRKTVDDKRRDVRRVAVDCRSRWFLY